MYAVVEHPYMVGTEAAHVYRFQAAHAAVVFELYAREVAYGVGHRKAVELFEFIAREFLWGDDFGSPAGADGEFL